MTDSVVTWEDTGPGVLVATMDRRPANALGPPIIDGLNALLDEAERRGLIWRDHERVVPTELGQRFLNDLLQVFLPQRSASSAGACDTPH